MGRHAHVVSRFLRRHAAPAMVCSAIVLSAGAGIAAQPQSVDGTDTGYFAPGAQPDATAYLPPPPQPGTARQAVDDTAFATTRALKGRPRWALATSDADLHEDALLHSFSCAAGFMLDKASTPHLAALIHKMDVSEIADMRNSKAYWHRPRPFVGNDQPICTEPDRAHLATSGSYPSGHTMLGWSTALVLADLLPQRATQILQRGRTFGESRIVCGVHWESDVQAGYMVGSAEIAAMQGSPDFRADMELARTELAARQQVAAKPRKKTCNLESSAAQHSPL